MSASSVAYHLRVNKYVDRRLFVEALALVGRYQDIAASAYISMGGGYLEDFRVLHQAFGIKRMLSFDYEEWMSQRQNLNKPYGFIRCQVASADQVVDRLPDERASLVGPDGRVIVWLDYTAPKDRYAQLSEFQRLVSKLGQGDVFRITLNAARNSFGTNDQFLLAKKSGKSPQKTVSEWWHEKFVEQLDDYFPPDRKDAEFMQLEYDFAVTLSHAVRRAALEGLKPREAELVVEPLLAVAYSDGQQMLTVTGIVLEKHRRDEFREKVRWSNWEFKPGDEWEEVVDLAVPHLSIRERQLIHQIMYFDRWDEPSSLLGFRLHKQPEQNAEMVNQYLTHYSRYPTFAPSDIL